VFLGLGFWRGREGLVAFGPERGEVEGLGLGQGKEGVVVSATAQTRGEKKGGRRKKKRGGSLPSSFLSANFKGKKREEKSKKGQG
jgi:hypothetical protein